MTIKVSSLLEGTIFPKILEVELNSHLNIPSLHFIGLPGAEIIEAKIRVESAFLASNLKFPLRKIVVNFVPADFKKCGTHLDLPIAVAILLSHHILQNDITEHELLHSVFAVGELSLSGTLRDNPKLIRSLSAAIQSKSHFFVCTQNDYEKIITSCKSTFKNESHLKIIHFIVVNSLNELEAILKKSLDLNHKHNEKADALQKKAEFESPIYQTLENSLKTKSQTNVRTLTSQPLSTTNDDLSTLNNIFIPLEMHKHICLSLGGHHHLLIVGPKGQGKSFALNCIEKIAEKLFSDLPLEAQFIKELSHHQNESSQPIRKVGCHVRPQALIGKSTGDLVYPGEFTKAHSGILIADEFLEWSRDAIESFREPLESGKVFLSRGRNTFELPASFILVASANECPCGGYQNEKKSNLGEACQCGSKEKLKYKAKLSGPIKDRISLHLLWNGEDPNEIKKIPLSETLMIIQRMRSSQIEKQGKLFSQLNQNETRELDEKFEHFHIKMNYTNYRKKVQTLKLALTLNSFYEKEKLDFTDFEEADRLLTNRDYHLQ